jgi:hypothetical protein
MESDIGCKMSTESEDSDSIEPKVSTVLKYFKIEVLQETPQRLMQSGGSSRGSPE